MSAAEKADWLLEENLVAVRVETGVHDAAYRVRRLGSEETAFISWSPDTGRVLIDGEDLELDERAWGLSDDLIELGEGDGREFFLGGWGEDGEAEADNFDQEGPWTRSKYK